MIEKDLKGNEKIGTEHIENNLAVRKMLHERGVKPEQLPPSEDISKVRSKLMSDEKKMIKDAIVKRKK